MIRLPVLSLSCLAVGQLIFSEPRAHAQKAESKTVAGTQVFEAIRLLTSYAEVGLPNEDTIKEDRTFDGSVLAANVLTLMPGSRLIFSAATGDRADRYIFVRTLRIVGTGGPPPTITWDRELKAMRITAPVGKAPPGSIGGGEGADGAAGPDGQTGNPGFPGRSAPTIYLVVSRIEGSAINVDLRGQGGGLGGVGQTGGDGGLGRSGAPGVAILGSCRSPGGNGGNGGSGGNGGAGGEGGRGGNGGTFVLLAPAQALERLAQALNVDIRPGDGGQGGDGGDPGRGGEGGARGRAELACPAGEPGKDGSSGKKGPEGQRGVAGQSGIFAKTALTDQQVRSLQLGGPSRK